MPIIRIYDRTLCPLLYLGIFTNSMNLQTLLISARRLYTQGQLAQELGISTRTLRRWEKGDTRILPGVRTTLERAVCLGTAGDGDNKVSQNFTFIDLFAGIGGTRLGFEGHGGRCIYTSEWNKFAAQTYRSNFSDGHGIAGDITEISEHDIPDHDVLLAGFPCQPFSIAGVSKRKSLGIAHGFNCTTQGTLFYDIARIIVAKKPVAFLLENVKNLLSHNKSNTFQVILDVLQQELGYHVHYKVIDARHFVPQHRERLIIVGFRERTDFSWNEINLSPVKEHPTLRTILHPQDGSEEPEEPYTEGPSARVSSRYILTRHLWSYLKDYARRQKEKNNGFGYGLFGPDNVARTLSARYYKDGSEILISRGKRKNPRRLTPRECARLMGFDNANRKINIPVSDTQAYKQFGNSVAVPVISEVARIMKPYILRLRNGENAYTGQVAFNLM